MHIHKIVGNIDLSIMNLWWKYFKPFLWYFYLAYLKEGVSISKLKYTTEYNFDKIT